MPTTTRTRMAGGAGGVGAGLLPWIMDKLGMTPPPWALYSLLAISTVLMLYAFIGLCIDAYRWLTQKFKPAESPLVLPHGYEVQPNRSRVVFTVAGIVLLPLLAWVIWMLWGASLIRDQVAKSAPKESGAPTAAPKERSIELKAYIDEWRTFRLPSDPSSEQIFLLVSVVNTGRPTVIQSFGLSINQGRPDERIATRLVIDKPERLYYPDGSLADVVNPADALDGKVFPQPIPTGGSQRGWLRFIFRNTPKEVIDRQDNTWRLHYSDAYGNHLHAFYTGGLSFRKQPPRHYPGLTPPSRP